jgi:hypothetical protein
MTTAAAPVAVTALPTPPTTSDPTSFDARADATLVAQQTMVPQINTALLNVFNNAVAAYESAISLSGSQIAAASSASSAQAAALAAQSAAGLSPLPNAGRIIKTEGVSNVITAAQALAAGVTYECNTTASAFTVTLPANPNVGDWIMLTDHAGTCAANNLTVARNGKNIQALAEDLIIDINNISVMLVYINSAKGWAVK